MFTGVGVDDLRGHFMVDEAKEFLGPRPKLWPTNDLDASLSESPTTVLTAVNGRPALGEKLHDLCKFVWSDLIKPLGRHNWRNRRYEDHEVPDVERRSAIGRA